MEINMEDIISQQISAAIDALSHAKSRIASSEVDLHLDVAASFIQDIQFNVMFLNVKDHDSLASAKLAIESHRI